jgi:hypothetical protein
MGIRVVTGGRTGIGAPKGTMIGLAIGNGDDNKGG